MHFILTSPLEGEFPAAVNILSSSKFLFMRRILLILLAGTLPFAFMSCNNATETSSAAKASGNNSAAEKNLASSKIITDAFKTGDQSKIDSAVASDFVDHTDHGVVKGSDSLKAMITSIHQNYADMKSDVIKEVGDDEYVFTLMHFSGTSNGAMGMPKGPYDMHTVEVTRYKDGKAVEHWGYMQPEEMMKMMPMPPMPAETKKK
jgi:predicted SnoaL-like aldol condensation-catalyzing enzyme